MAVSLPDVHQALTELGKLRFGEMRVEDAMREIVQTTHAILQIRHHEGPCIAAFEEKQLVGVEDLSADSRWPLFSTAAVDYGVRAVLASPLPYNQDAVGFVTVLSERPAPGRRRESWRCSPSRTWRPC